MRTVLDGDAHESISSCGSHRLWNHVFRLCFFFLASLQERSMQNIHKRMECWVKKPGIPKGPDMCPFDPNKRFHSFGYEAEEKYADLAEDGKAPDWYYFRRFKMTLYNKMTLKRNFDLEADDGKTLPAMTVFSACLKYLVNHLFKSCEDRICGIRRIDIRWVLTVPVIWNDAAKQFMREAAEKADIPGDQLLIALEPEAASIFCQHLPIKMLTGTEGGFQLFQTGSKYLVLDAGSLLLLVKKYNPYRALSRTIPLKYKFLVISGHIR